MEPTVPPKTSAVGFFSLAKTNPDDSLSASTFQTSGGAMDSERNEYRYNEALGSTDVKNLLKSPALFAMSRTTRSRPTPAMELGTAIHAAILEPQKLSEIVYTGEKLDLRTKAGREAKEAIVKKGQVMLSEDQREILEIVRSIFNPLDGHTREEMETIALTIEHMQFKEYSLITTSDCGTPIKALFDTIDLDLGFSVDIKTMTAFPTPRKIATAAIEYGWREQAGHYANVFEAATSKPLQKFSFLTIQTCEPFAVSMVDLDPADLHWGRVKAREAYKIYRNSMEANFFDQGAPYRQTLDFPEWAK